MSRIPTLLASLHATFGCAPTEAIQTFPPGTGEGEAIAGSAGSTAEGEGTIPPIDDRDEGLRVAEGEGEGEGGIDVESEGEGGGAIGVEGEGEGQAVAPTEGEGAVGDAGEGEIAPAIPQLNLSWADLKDCDLADIVLDDPGPFQQLQVLCQGKIMSCDLFQGLESSRCVDATPLEDSLSVKIHSRLDDVFSAITFEDADGYPGAMIWNRAAHSVTDGVTLQTHDIISGGGVIAFAANSAFGATLFEGHLLLSTRDLNEEGGHRTGRIWAFPSRLDGTFDLGSINQNSYLQTHGKQALQFLRHDDDVMIVSAGSREGAEMYPGAIDLLSHNEEEDFPWMVEQQGEDLAHTLEPFKKFETGGIDAASLLMASGGHLLIRNLNDGTQELVPVSESPIVAVEWHPDAEANTAFVVTEGRDLFTVVLGEVPLVSAAMVLPGTPIAMDLLSSDFMGCFLYVAQTGGEGQTIISALTCEGLTAF